MAKNAAAGNERIGVVRFFVFLAILVAVGLSTEPWLGLVRSVLVGFDVAAVFFLASTARLFFVPEDHVRQASIANDATRGARLVVQLVLAAVVFASLTAVIIDPERLGGDDKLLIAASLALVWIFANASYMIHYAHLYYSSAPGDPREGGLNFPGVEKPTMADFAYFAFTIGVALQTADVAITSARIRRVATGQQIVAFFFNIGVLALVINVIGNA